MENLPYQQFLKCYYSTPTSGGDESTKRKQDASDSGKKNEEQEFKNTLDNTSSKDSVDKSQISKSNAELQEARKNIRGMQRKVFQQLSRSKANSHEIESPFIPMNEKMVSKPHDPREIRTRLHSRAPAPLAVKDILLDSLKHPFTTADDELHHLRRRNALFAIGILVAFGAMFLLMVYVGDATKNIADKMNYSIASTYYDAFFHAPYHVERSTECCAWILKWIWDKFDPCALLIVGEEPGVGKKWMLKRILANRKQAFYFDVSESGDIPLNEFVVDVVVRDPEMHTKAENRGIDMNKALQSISFLCSTPDTLTSVFIFDLSKIPNSMVSDKLWDCIELNHEVNDLFPTEIMASQRGGIDVNADSVEKSVHDVYPDAPVDDRFRTGIKFIILMNDEQLKQCDTNRIYNYLHHMRLNRFTQQEAEQYLNQRKVLLGRVNEPLRKKFQEEYRDLFLNPKELFRFCNYLDRGVKKQESLIKTRRQLKKQITVLESMKDDQDISSQIEALTNQSAKYSSQSEEHLSLNQEELKNYSEGERELHIALLKEELESVRAKILPFDQYISNYLQRRKEIVHSNQTV